MQERLPAIGGGSAPMREVSTANAALFASNAGGGRGAAMAARTIRSAEPLPPIGASAVSPSLFGGTSMTAKAMLLHQSQQQALPSAGATLAAVANAAARVKTMPVIIHYIVRPHLPPCFTDAAIVPAEARVDDIALCAANTFFAHCDSMGHVLGPLPSADIKDYGLFLLRPDNMRAVETNRMAAACADPISDPRAYGDCPTLRDARRRGAGDDCGGDGLVYGEDADDGGDTAESDGDGENDDDVWGSPAPAFFSNNGGPGGNSNEALTFGAARRPTVAANIVDPFGNRETSTPQPQQQAQRGERRRRRQGKVSARTASITLPPIPPHPSQRYQQCERTEGAILEADFEACHGRAVMLRLMQATAQRRTAEEVALIVARSGGGGGASDSTTADAAAPPPDGDEDPAIVAAKVRARVGALYQYNPNAAAEFAARQRDEAASLLHSQIAGALRPPELYFCVTSAFLAREGAAADEEERRAAIELIWEGSWGRLLAYAELWRGRSAAAEAFRAGNAASRAHFEGCEAKVRARLLAKEAAEWGEKFANFAKQFASLELGMLAQYHHMRRLRERHRGEIDRRLEEEGPQQPNEDHYGDGAAEDSNSDSG